LISAKNRVDLSSISEVRSYITEWPRFFGPPCMSSWESVRCNTAMIEIAYKRALSDRPSVCRL